LNADLAREVIERVIASPLGISVEEAAAGVVRLLEQNLLHAVQRISIERGYDPRQFVLVAGGGAGPMHAARIGWLLGCRKVYVPRLSGAFCALGMLHSNVRHDHVRAYVQRLDQAALAAVDDAFRELEDRATRGLQEAGFGAASMRLTREMDLRYVGQQWDVRVRLEADTALRATWIRKAFETEYDRLFGHYQPDGIIETANVRVIAIGLIPPLRPSSSAAAVDTPRPIERRSVYLDAEHGWAEIDVYRGSELHRRHRLSGPLLIEEQTTTVLVGPRDIIEVDEADNFVIEVGVRA
jgi:N-methylhydantoinase A